MSFIINLKLCECVREKKRGIEREGGDTERERECVVCMRERERESER